MSGVKLVSKSKQLLYLMFSYLFHDYIAIHFLVNQFLVLIHRPSTPYHLTHGFEVFCQAGVVCAINP